jgi:DNA-binding beta-propeller fold protein YncE
LQKALAVVAGMCVAAAAEAPARTPRQSPDFGGAAYAVDPKWPAKPAGVQWAEMPGVDVDGRDQVYLFTRNAPYVQVYSASGAFVRAWEQPFKLSHHLKIDPEGNVWTTDIGTHTVQKFTPEGKLLLTLGTPGQSGCDSSHFNQPTDAAFTAAGEVFVSDGYGNTRVVHFDKNGKYVKEWGKRGNTPGNFVLPHTIAVDSKNRILVGDRDTARIQVFDTSGKLLAVWHKGIMPWGLRVTPKGEVWVVGSSPVRDPAKNGFIVYPPPDQLMLKLGPEGRILGRWSLPKGKDGEEKPGELNWLHCVGVDSADNLYLGDIQGKRLQKFTRQTGVAGDGTRR